MLETKTHKLIMIDILKEIYSDASLGSVLGFKGGTALYLFYDLPRFSVDLDFDLLKLDKKEEVFGKIEAILEKHGKVRQAYDKHYTLFFLLSYKTGERQVKIEISKRNVGSKYELKNYLGIPMWVMVKKDLAAHKLVAMVDRTKPANRDVFDVWFMFKKNWQINWQMVEKISQLKQGKFLDKCLKHLNKMPRARVLGGMGDLLSKKMKFWVKEHLIEDTIFQIKLYLDTLDK